VNLSLNVFVVEKCLGFVLKKKAYNVEFEMKIMVEDWLSR